ncbi:MAG: O-antigen ligase family protein [Tannerella sp.]|jgi:O-antigen ligase|nr:O-antigen ligase family protein [Tannerella sp.]
MIEVCRKYIVNACKSGFHAIACNFTVTCAVLLLFTVCAIDKDLWRGFATAKYFYFACVTGIAVIAATVESTVRKQRSFVIRQTDVTVFLFFGYIIIHHMIISDVSGIQWHLLLLMIPLYVLIRIIQQPDAVMLLTYGFISVIFVEAVWGILQFYRILPSYHHIFPITGSLFNPGPYSGFIAVGTPLALSRILPRHVGKIERVLCLAVLAVVLWALALAESRAAWLAALAGIFILLWIRYGKHVFDRKWLAPVSVFVAIMALSLFVYKIYSMGKGSADGRMLIWKVSLSQIKDKPLWGAGYGKCTAIYGDAQIAYFQNGEASEREMMLAGNPEYIFNEYIHIMLEFGIMGLLLFILMILSSFFPLGKAAPHVIYYRTAMCVWLIFAMFSYPFDILPLTVLLVAVLAVNASQSRVLTAYTCRHGVLAVWIIGVALTCVQSIKVLNYRQYYYNWPYAKNLFNSGGLRDAIEEYEYLYEKLKYERIFLGEYAKCLAHAGRYETADRMIDEYLLVRCDTEAYLVKGDVNKAMKQYAQAEQAYLSASYLVPSKFATLYALMLFYSETGRMEKAKETAGSLLEKPIKIPSKEVDSMRLKAEQILKELQVIND